ncbi:MAG: hypothetical protein ACI8R8_000999, partial [Paraglaciecola sp.]
MPIDKPYCVIAIPVRICCLWGLQVSTGRYYLVNNSSLPLQLRPFKLLLRDQLLTWIVTTIGD